MSCGRGDDDCMETFARSSPPSSQEEQRHYHQARPLEALTPSSSDTSPSQPDSIDPPTLAATLMRAGNHPLTPELQAAVQAADAAVRRDNNHYAALKEIFDAALDMALIKVESKKRSKSALRARFDAGHFRIGQ